MNILLSIRKYALLAPITIGALLPLSNLSAVELVASDGAAGNLFGVSSGISGNTAIVGAFVNNSYTGAVYLFDATTGEQTFKLTASDGVAYDRFGYSSGISGNTAIVGAYSKKSSTGAAYLFDAATGEQTFKLMASDGVAGDQFGWSSGISGNTAIVGARGKNSSTGAAYLFDATTGEQTFKLTASDGAAYDYFGSSLGISGNTVIVGAFGKNFDTGAAYLFDATTGEQTFKLTASDGAANDNFGLSVGISGNTVVVGAFGKNSYTGAAYLFDATTGEQTFKLTASDGATSDNFGSSSAISGNTVIVGANGKDSFTGAAYLFDATTGEQTFKLTASDGAAYDNFGISVAIDGDSFVVGSYSAGNNGKAFSGSVSSMTTLDDGSTKVISGISFESSVDWIIGQNTSGNTVILSAGDTASVTESDKAVYIGQNAGSNNNTLIIAGNFDLREIHVGSLDGNSGNLLQFEMETAAIISIPESVYLATGNSIAFEGVDISVSEFIEFFALVFDAGIFDFYVQDGIVYTFVESSDILLDLIDRGILFITETERGGILVMALDPTPIPEPAEVAALVGLLALGFVAYRRRSSALQK